MILDPDDVAEADRAKVREALGRFRVETVADTGATFGRVYDLLDSYFGPKGELEARDVLAGFVENRGLPYGNGMEGHYRLLAAWDGDELVGARDLYVDLDLSARVCVVALSHSYVVPHARRSGLAALFRAVPVSLARALTHERLGPGEPAEILVGAEMEPISDDPGSIVRLVAYGKSGFVAIDPVRLPYSQPDFRDLEPDSAHLAIPLMPIIRWLGHEHATEIPVWLAAAFPRLFHSCHRQYLPRERVDPSEVHALRALTRSRLPVALLQLPHRLDDHDRIAPLALARVHAAYPRILRGPS